MFLKQPLSNLSNLGLHRETEGEKELPLSISQLLFSYFVADSSSVEKYRVESKVKKNIFKFHNPEIIKYDGIISNIFQPICGERGFLKVILEE